MNKQTDMQTILRSSSVRAMSVAILVLLFAAQLIFVLPAILYGQNDAESQLLVEEQTHLSEQLARYKLVELRSIELDADRDVLGVVFFNEQGERLLGVGSRILDEQRTPTVNVKATLPPNSTTALWWLRTADRSVQVLALLDTGDLASSTVYKTLLAVFVMFLAAVAGTAAVVWCTGHYFLMPLHRLVDEMRSNRARSVGQIPETIEFAETPELGWLTDEFNGLIDAQQKSARQVKVKQQYLEFAAHHDPLTHLPNRLMFEDTLKRTVAEAVKDNSHFAIFLVDLDNFKFFNDQYGHLVGDKMVSEVGNRLRSMMRDVDLVARLDGDEFVVIQKNVTDQATAEEVARRLMSEATARYEYRGFTLKAAVSVGISCFPQDVHGGHNEEMLGEEIVNNASVALQEAKSNGKNQFQLFNDSMRSRLTARIRLEQDLKIALQEGQFEVYYQPKINLRTREVTGAEALVRWRHPVNGPISPETFVPVAEEAGLIIELGEYILRTACRETNELHRMGYGGLNVAVNISAVQFTDGNLLPMVSKALADTELAPELLELEITESAVMHDPEEVVHSLHELSRFGMRLAIDDFGTGYSSLAYLKRFPVDTLKIDRAFITDISSDNDDVAIVEAVLGLGKHFNMRVIAEGVEDEEQLQFLRTQGCDLAQGFHIGRPMRLGEYRQWIDRWPHGIQQAGVDGSAIHSEASGEVAKTKVTRADVLPLRSKRR